MADFYLTEIKLTPFEMLWLTKGVYPIFKLFSLFKKAGGGL
jgi:hypothetical protein